MQEELDEMLLIFFYKFQLHFSKGVSYIATTKDVCAIVQFLKAAKWILSK